MPGYTVKGKSQIQIQPKSPLGDTKQVPEILVNDSSSASRELLDRSTNTTSDNSNSVNSGKSAAPKAGNVDKLSKPQNETKNKKISKPVTITKIIEGKENKSTTVSAVARLEVEITSKQALDGDKNFAGPGAKLGLDKLNTKNKKNDLSRDKTSPKLKGRNYSLVRPDRLVGSLIDPERQDKKNDNTPQSDDTLNTPKDKAETAQETKSEIDNVIQLPINLKDTFLNSRGISSAYPSIILTTKKNDTSQLNVNDAMMFIKMNNTIKINVEKAANKLLKSTSISDDVYSSNVELMKNYAQLCLNTANSKDDFVKLLNIYNTQLTPEPFFSNRGRDLKHAVFIDTTRVRDYVSKWESYYPLGIEETAQNTQLILQFFKNFYMTYLFGGIAFNPTGYPPNTSSIVGNYKGNAAGIIDGLKKISARSTQISTNLFDGSSIFDTSILEDQLSQSMAAYFIVKDLVIHNQRANLESIQSGQNITESLGNLIGVYYPDTLSAAADTGGGIANLQDFMQNNRKGRIRTVFLNSDRSATVGLLDTEKSPTSQYITGIDVLLNDDLLKLTNNPQSNVDLQKAKSFINNYKNLCTDIANFYTKSSITMNEALESDKSGAFMFRIANYFISWITQTQIDKPTGELRQNSDSNLVRAFMLFRAATAGEQKFSLKLFRLMCVNDKLSQTGIPSDIKTQLETEQTNIINTIMREMFPKEAVAVGSDFTYSSNGSDVSYYTPSGEFALEAELQSNFNSRVERSNAKKYRDALKIIGSNGPSSLFTFCHNAARSIERDLKFRTDTNFSNCNLKTSEYGGLSLNTDARAFVIYKIFLSLLRNTKYRINSFLGFGAGDPEFEDKRPPIWYMKVNYTPMNFDAMKFALENVVQTFETFDNTVNSLTKATTIDGIAKSNVTGKDILQNQKNSAKIYHRRIRSIKDFITETDSKLYSIVRLFSQHQSRLEIAFNTFEQSNLIVTHSFIRDNRIFDNSKLINDIQLDQAKIKAIIAYRYANKYKYLPSITDYNEDQSRRLGPCLSPNAKLFPTGKNVQYVVVGIPAGMLENMRYKNVYDINESFVEIEVVIKGLQVNQKNESNTATKSLKYRFSSNLFINDFVKPKVVKYDKVKTVFDSTQLAEIDRNQLKALIPQAAIKRYGRDTVINHLVSYYSSLILRCQYGLNVSEHVFDLVDREISYPDPTLQSDYLEIFKNFMSVSDYTDTPENNLFIQRVMNDVARSTSFSPGEHFTAGTATKLFERVFVIPIDFSEFENLKFLNVMTKINLLPVTTTPQRQR